MADFGTALSDNFMLGTASVMVGPQDELFDLNPTDHGLGLVKNFTITSAPTYTTLTQGVKNTNVASVMTANAVSANMEVYEYTAKNIATGLGLENAGFAPITTSTTVSTAGTGTPTVPDDEVAVVSATGIVANDFVMIGLGNDNVIIRKVASVATNTLTVTPGIEVIVPIGATVSKVNTVPIGSLEDQPYLSAKIVGQLANGQVVVILIPKLRISAGFTLGFVTSDFSNMPFEFTLFNQVPTDPFYADFGTDQAHLYTKA